MVRKLGIAVLLVILACVGCWGGICLAQIHRSDDAIHKPGTQIREVDGSPAGWPIQLKFDNGTLTNNGDGTYTHSMAGAGLFLKLDQSTPQTTTGNFQLDQLEIIDSNITYVPIAGDIETYVTNATAGDTLILASGTYTITDDIDIAKAINIKGQGIGKTTISCATAAKNVFDISASNVRISDLSISNTGATTSVGINVSTPNLTGFVFENLDISTTGTTGGCIYLLGNNATIRTVTGSGLGSVSGYIVNLSNDSSVTQDAIVNCYNVKGSTTGGAGGNRAFTAYNNNDANIVTLNLYECVGVGSNSATDYGLIVTSTTTNNAYANAYSCSFNGADYDVCQTGTNTLTLHDCELVNGTTSGTITYDGTVVSEDFYAADDATITDLLSFDEADWTGGNVVYVPLAGDIETYVNNATAGDTLVLASGTYSITDDIDITKQVSIIGQGIGETIISGSKAGALVCFDCSASNIRIANLTITGVTTGNNLCRGVVFDGTAGTILSGCVVEHCNITAQTGGTGATTPIFYLDAGGTVRDCYLYANGTNFTNSEGILHQTNSTAEANTTLDVYDTYAKATSAGSSYSVGFMAYDNTASNDAILNLYNCVGYGTGAGSNEAGVLAGTGADAIVNVYGGSYQGDDADAVVATAGTVTLHGNVELVNGTTSGTITYDGTIVTEDLYASDDIFQIDSGIHYFGTGNDTTLSFDGDSFNIIANATTATDDFEVTADDMTITADILNKADTDAVAVFGRVKVGYNGSAGDYAAFGHYDSMTGTGYALCQSSTGDTYLNAANGKSIFFHINNSMVGQWSSTGLGIGASPAVSGLTIDPNSNTAGIRLYGTDAANEYADFYVTAANDLTVDSTGRTILADLVTAQPINYAADAEVSDAYAVTITGFVLTAGVQVWFKANTINTGACTLNVNGGGAVALKSKHDTDPEDGYIEAGSIVHCIYDGSVWQMLQPDANP